MSWSENKSRKRCRWHLFFWKNIKNNQKVLSAKTHSKKMIHTDSVMEFWGESSCSAASEASLEDLVSAPCVRGWTYLLLQFEFFLCVRPVRTGITLSTLHKNFGFINPPRVYGDEPFPDGFVVGIDVFTQYARGWVYHFYILRTTTQIRPVSTGINLSHTAYAIIGRDQPCIRRGRLTATL